VRREADDGVDAEDAPGHLRWGVVLADVHAVSPAGQRQVRAVVEDERNAPVGADLSGHRGAGEQRSGLEVFFPELHNVNPALDAGGQELLQVRTVAGAEVQPAPSEVSTRHEMTS
jgi:hypothetical protein